MKKLSKEQMKKVIGGTNELTVAPGDGECIHVGNACTKDDDCCSKGCDTAMDGKHKYCAGA